MSKQFNHHEPVLLSEILDFVSLLPGNFKYYMDVTFGRGGHARAIMNKMKAVKTIAFDQDLTAIDFGKSNFKDEFESNQILFINSNFSQVEAHQGMITDFLNDGKPSLILADLGVSSPQLDDPERGFSFYNTGPLDMRMNRKSDLTAAEIINTWSEDELMELFLNKGEIRRPGRLVEMIISYRSEKLFSTTKELADLVVKTFGWKKKGSHPATQTFLALRLEVNKELEVVEKSIESLIKLLDSGGLLLVLTFHSLEDRIVKYKFKELAGQYGEILTKKVIQPKWAEKKKNKRARSAKLRVFRRV